MENEFDMFLTIVVVLLSVMVTVVCALLFFGGSEILDTLKRLNENMEKVVSDNDKDHRQMTKRLDKNEKDIVRIDAKIDGHLKSHK